jgi:hypothetical protein
MEIPKTQYYFKINESKVWINNQLSEIPNENIDF